jgi:hypothetical protein
METHMTEAPGQFEDRQRWLIYASYATACGMVICFAIIFVQFLLWLFPALDTRGLVFVCTLVGMEAFLSFWLVKHLPTAQRQITYYRGTELVILLVAVKLFTELRAGPASFWKDILLWPIHFPSNILTGQYFLTMLPVLASWWAGYLFAADLSMLGTEDASILDERFRETPVRTVILRRFLSLGIFIVLLAAIPAQNIFQISMPVASKGVPAAICYFVLGIILLSLTKYITLETDWHKARLHIPVQVPRRWFTYSAIILAALVFLISWLPTHYGMGFFDTLNAVFFLLYQFVIFLYDLFLLVLSLIARLLTRNPPDGQAPISQATRPPENPPVPNTSTYSWDLVKSIFLWGSLIVLVIVVLRQYIAYNRDLSEELRRFRPLRWFLSIWDRFITSFRKANKSFGGYIQNSLKRLRSPGPKSAKVGEWDFINLRRLSPRQKVIFYYLAVVRRAKEAGFPRRESQTPFEYARSLDSNLKEAKGGVDAITESFIEARYSRHDIPAKAAMHAASIWETIRRVLRNVRRSHQDDKSKEN